MTDGDSMTINHLCDSAKGTFVNLDDYLPLTKALTPECFEETGQIAVEDVLGNDLPGGLVVLADGGSESGGCNLLD